MIFPKNSYACFMARLVNWIMLIMRLAKGRMLQIGKVPKKQYKLYPRYQDSRYELEKMHDAKYLTLTLKHFYHFLKSKRKYYSTTSDTEYLY